MKGRPPIVGCLTVPGRSGERKGAVLSGKEAQVCFCTCKVKNQQDLEGRREPCFLERWPRYVTVHVK